VLWQHADAEPSVLTIIFTLMLPTPRVFAIILGEGLATVATHSATAETTLGQIDRKNMGFWKHLRQIDFRNQGLHRRAASWPLS
jgi:hypothetical protein